MGKRSALCLAILLLCAALAGCGPAASEAQSEEVRVYSFSGEHEQFSISNGIIVLTPAKEIFYGGRLEEKQPSELTAYSVTFYAEVDDEPHVLLSMGAQDLTGGTVQLSGDMGSRSGEGALLPGELDELPDVLYVTVDTTDSHGETNQYQLPLTLTEVT